MADTIPPEIITDILLRLPEKSLGRFRSVSKDFLSLISDPKFIKTHFKTLNQNHIFFSNWYLLYSHPFHHHEDEAALLTPTEFDLTMDFDTYFYCGSCNGLVLVYLRWRNGNYRLVLYNPITKDFLELPLLDITTMTGFGYDSVTYDYKVVTIAYCGCRSRSKVVHVYSLRTNTWRPLIDHNSYDYGINGYIGVFVNGFVHWIAEKKSNGLHVIVAFSFADEIFSEVPSPNLCNDDVDFISNTDCRLFALGGKLAIFVEGVVWLMNEYGKKESWTKILLCGIDEIQMEKPVVFDVNGKILMADEDRVVVYDVEKRSFGKTVYVWNQKHFKVKGTCEESLVSPKFSITN